MKVIKKKYFHFINNNQNIQINNRVEEPFNLYIVYFINCLTNNNYFDWLKNQINMVYNYNGIIYIIATLAKKEENFFRKRVLSIYPNVIIECNYTNDFEYPGILKVWELGQIHNKSNDIILYFHSKGLTHYPNYQGNIKDNYNIILKKYDKIREIFTIFPTIDKIGYYSGGIGWIWYNFWYARGSYINSVEKPIKTKRRHYYEDWLSRKIKYTDKNSNNNERPLSYYENTLKNCYGFFRNNYFGNIGSKYCERSNRMLYI
jgi:hypothetical protein